MEVKEVNISGVVDSLESIKPKGSEVLFGWYGDDCDLYLNLGTMKNAVVIRQSIKKNFYFISEGSYFSFYKEIYAKKFDTIIEAKTLANTYVSEWLLSVINALKL